MIELNLLTRWPEDLLEIAVDDHVMLHFFALVPPRTHSLRQSLSIDDSNSVDNDKICICSLEEKHFHEVTATISSRWRQPSHLSVAIIEFCGPWSNSLRLCILSCKRSMSRNIIIYQEEKSVSCRDPSKARHCRIFLCSLLCSKDTNNMLRSLSSSTIKTA